MKKSSAALLSVLSVLALAAPAEGFVRDASADKLWMDTTLMAMVSNRGSETESFYAYVMLYDPYGGGLRYIEGCCIMDLEADASRKLDFPIVVREPGPYPPRCSVALCGDENPENDTVSLSVVQPIRDVSADSLRLYSRGLSAFLANRGIDYADVYLRLRIEDSTGAVVHSTVVYTQIPGLTSERVSYEIGGYEMATYAARCTVDYDEDENTSNDTASLRIVPPLCDVAVEILWPVGYVDSGATGHPTFRARNEGDSCANFFLFYRIDSTYSDSQFVEGLPPYGDTIVQLHDEWLALLPGRHPALCSLAYPFFHAWAHPSSVYVRGAGAVAESEPRRGSEPVRVALKPGGFVLYGPAEALEHVLVFDPTGRKLATTRRHESGCLHVSGLSPGVYFVSTEDSKHKLALTQ